MNIPLREHRHAWRGLQKQALAFANGAVITFACEFLPRGQAFPGWRPESHFARGMKNKLLRNRIPKAPEALTVTSGVPRLVPLKPVKTLKIIDKTIHFSSTPSLLHIIVEP